MVRTGTRVLYLKIQKFYGTRVRTMVRRRVSVLEYHGTKMVLEYHGTYTCTNHGTPVRTRVLPFFFFFWHTTIGS